MAGLRLLSCLTRVAPAQEGDLLLNLTACVASFTDRRELWSSSAASEQATLILSHILEAYEPQRVQLLLADLLLRHVKPEFAKSQNAAITQQGRKAIDPTPYVVSNHESEEEVKPWKFTKAYIIPVFGWVLSNLPVTDPHDLSLSVMPANDLLENLVGRKLATSNTACTCHDRRCLDGTQSAWM